MTFFVATVTAAVYHVALARPSVYIAYSFDGMLHSNRGYELTLAFDHPHEAVHEVRAIT